jgi:hypothetical protein
VFLQHECAPMSELWPLRSLLGVDTLCSLVERRGEQWVKFRPQVWNRKKRF